MKRLLETRGVIVQSPRETFREAAINWFIEDPTPWFNFIKIRNITVHTYDEEEIATVLSCLEPFSQALSAFSRKIGVPV